MNPNRRLPIAILLGFLAGLEAGLLLAAFADRPAPSARAPQAAVYVEPPFPSPTAATATRYATDGYISIPAGKRVVLTAAKLTNTHRGDGDPDRRHILRGRLPDLCLQRAVVLHVPQPGRAVQHGSNNPHGRQAARVDRFSRTSQNSSDAGTIPSIPVPQQPFSGNISYQLVGINDLGMHCGDLDTRIASILPPFQVLLTQVIQKGSRPVLLGPSQVDVFYSAAANPSDPILTQTNPDPFTGRLSNGHVYKTNFWNVIASYDPFYPPGVLVCAPNPGSSANCVVPPDKGLPVPNVENLYIGPDGRVNSGDELLTAVQHAIPGLMLSRTKRFSTSHKEHGRRT